MALQELIQITSRPKMDFWKLIQIYSRLKKFQGYFDLHQLMTQKTFKDFDSNQLMTKKIWNIDLYQVMTQWFESTDYFVDRFLGFRSISLTFLGFHSISLTFFEH